jgi:hypothetical protein
MMSKIALVLVGCLAIIAPHRTLGQQLYAYPTKGQTPEQQSRDQQECAGWAMQQTGYQPGAYSRGPSSGGAVRGAAGGAAAGAIGGAIAGDAGKGAAIGAATGGLIGGVRQHNRNRQQANQAQQVNDAYRRAYAACLQGRGYSVQ